MNTSVDLWRLCMIGRLGDSGSSGVSDLAQIFLDFVMLRWEVVSAKEADNGAAPLS
jgi:hypothetical protein